MGRIARSMRAAAFACALAAAVPARAEDSQAQEAGTPPKAGPRVVREADKILVRKRTVIDFNDMTIEGELTRPDGSYLLNRRRTHFPSLLKLRDNFNPELQKSADNL
jgi:hypothetical protein